MLRFSEFLALTGMMCLAACSTNNANAGDASDIVSASDSSNDAPFDATVDVLQDASSDAAHDTSTDAVHDSGSATDPARGEYLVRHVLACGDCHTPRDSSGQPDMTRWLAGDPVGFDLNPADTTTGQVPVPNLTPDPDTGIGTWTDVQIRNAIREGYDDTGNALVSIMPYAMYHNLTTVDVNDVIAYLRTVPSVSQTIPERQPLGFTWSSPATPLADSDMPHTTLATTDANYASAERGRYLVEVSCVDCHSPVASGPAPIDAAHLLAGNRSFTVGSPWGTVYSKNITPHANGIAGWTAEQIQTALQQGVDDSGTALCPPMPSGPTGPFGGMTNDDALDIGHFLTTIPPVDNGVVPECAPTTSADAGDGG